MNSKHEFKVVSSNYDVEIKIELTALELLKSNIDDLIERAIEEEMDCCCTNTENGFFYCGCGVPFEECEVYLDGVQVIE